MINNFQHRLNRLHYFIQKADTGPPEELAKNYRLAGVKYIATSNCSKTWVHLSRIAGSEVPFITSSLQRLILI